MKHSQEEIINALKIIRDVCLEQKDGECEICCLGNSQGNCMVAYNPDSWAITDTVEFWRAFK